MLVPQEQLVRAQGLAGMVDDGGRFRIIEGLPLGQDAVGLQTRLQELVAVLVKVALRDFSSSL